MAPSTETQTVPLDAALPELLYVINTGSFGKVYRGALENGQAVAVKVIPLNDNSNLQALQQELRLCKQLQHPHIVHTHKVISTKENVYVVQEHCANGDLFEVITPLVGIGDEVKIRKYFRQLVDAIIYLHSMDLVHRDIKPENVVLTADDEVRLIDFGLSGLEGEQVEPCVGTVPYMAPEVYFRPTRNQMYNGKAADVFSLGIVLHVMIRGCYPWDTPSRHEPTFDSFVKNGYCFQQDWSAALDEIFRGCLHMDPRKRFTALELMKHLKREASWGLDRDDKNHYREAYSYSVLQEHEGELHGPRLRYPGQDDMDIVFADDFRPCDIDSTDEGSLISFPEDFNPLVDMPHKWRTRLVSECDGSVEIQFDPDIDSDRVVWAEGYAPAHLQEVEDDEEEAIPRWSWGRDNGEESERTSSVTSSEGHALWADLNKSMSFSTIPSFDGSDDKQSDAPSQAVLEELSWPTPLMSNIDKRADIVETDDRSTRWGDMSSDKMSFSTMSLFDDSVNGAPPVTSIESAVTTPTRGCLFSLGEEDDVGGDDELEQTREQSACSPLDPEIVTEENAKPILELLPGPPKFPWGSSCCLSLYAMQKTLWASRRPAEPGCIRRGSKVWVKLCSSAFNLRKAMSCINLPSC